LSNLLSIYRRASLRHGLFSALLIAGVVIAGVPIAQAVEVPTLYTAEVPYDRTARNARQKAYDSALGVVLLRVSGSLLSSDAMMIKQLFPDSSAYVVQFRPGARDTLWVSFDGQAIEQTLRDAGQTVWGSDRPLTVVWLAVDRGQGRREIVAADDPDGETRDARSIDRNALLRERILEIADRRGLPLVFPLLDAEDIQNVSFSDIWGGFDERIINASRRYAADSVLIGRVRTAGGSRENWSYYFSGAERRWNGSPESVVNQIADLLAAELSIGGSAPMSSVELAVSGVVSVDAYGELHQILGNASVIEDYRITEVSGDRVVLRAEVRGGPERLRRALQFTGLVEQEGGQEFGEVPGRRALEFYYSR
jgi:hypothetical protein